MKIGTILSHHAVRHPDRTAVIFGDRTLSFQALDARSHRLANALIARGLKPGANQARLYTVLSKPSILMLPWTAKPMCCEW
jgi:acyl-CoA synthetase (AMP-forming)/AMP-acid ligase II